MTTGNPDERPTQIATLRPIVQRAVAPAQQEVTAARQRLLERYGGAVKRYLLGASRDAEVAEELTQEFALRFLDGKYEGVDRERGRFRSFFKGVLAAALDQRHTFNAKSEVRIPDGFVDFGKNG